MKENQAFLKSNRNRPKKKREEDDNATLKTNRYFAFTEQLFFFLSQTPKLCQSILLKNRNFSNSNEEMLSLFFQRLRHDKKLALNNCNENKTTDLQKRYHAISISYRARNFFSFSLVHMNEMLLNDLLNKRLSCC